MKTAFPPIADAHARILILGSMPGEASLQAVQYYAWPHNAFWPIMAALLDFPREAPYEERCARLREHGIALWDVLAQCRREGSLDSAIEHDSAAANDFAAFLQRHPGIHTVCFNGKSVEQLFRRHVLRGQSLPGNLQTRTLPSTSPANARLRFDAKLKAWRETLAAIEGSPVRAAG